MQNLDCAILRRSSMAAAADNNIGDVDRPACHGEQTTNQTTLAAAQVKS